MNRNSVQLPKLCEEMKWEGKETEERPLYVSTANPHRLITHQ